LFSLILTTDARLVPRLRMGGDIPLLTYITSWDAQG